MPDPDVCIHHCGGENDPHPACRAHGQIGPPPTTDGIQRDGAGQPICVCAPGYVCALHRNRWAIKRIADLYGVPEHVMGEPGRHWSWSTDRGDGGAFIDPPDGWWDSLDDLTLPGTPSARKTATILAGTLALLLIAWKLVHRGS